MLPDEEGANRDPHLSAVLCHEPLSNVPPTTPYFQLAMEPFLCEMQLSVVAHLLLRRLSPMFVSGWDVE